MSNDRHVPQHIAHERFDLQFLAGKQSVRRRISFFGQRNRSRVKQINLSAFFCNRQMNVAKGENVTRIERRVFVGMIDMAVRQEKLAAVHMDHAIGFHHRIFNEHLVHFAVAVAAHGEDAVLVLIQQPGHFNWIVLIGQRVARTVVERIAENNDLIGLLRFKALLECLA